MKELWQHPVCGFPTLSSHFAFVLPCVPLLSLRAMIAVGTHPVALGVMLVVLSVSCHGHGIRVSIVSTWEKLVVCYMCWNRARMSQGLPRSLARWPWPCSCRCEKIEGERGGTDALEPCSRRGEGQGCFICSRLPQAPLFSFDQALLYQRQAD